MKYEMMTIYKNDLGEQSAADFSKKVQELVASVGGKVLENTFWGRRKFAYEIKHEIEGFYDIIKLESDSSTVTKLKAKLNLLNGLVRYLITTQE